MKKISTIEPAERPFTIALSESEIAALANWHLNIARGIPKKLGQATLKFSAENIFRTARDQKALIDHARDQVKAHCNRAKGLSSIIAK